MPEIQIALCSDDDKLSRLKEIDYFIKMKNPFYIFADKETIDFFAEINKKNYNLVYKLQNKKKTVLRILIFC